MRDFINNGIVSKKEQRIESNKEGVKPKYIIGTFSQLLNKVSNEIINLLN